MIFTSRYSNPELKTGKYTVVGVTRGAPKFRLGYALAGNIMEIAPPGYLFNEYDRRRFTPAYFRYMDRTGVQRIQQLLEHYAAYGKPVVLCCYEDVRNPDDWCHRLVFAEWWLQRTGELIEELPDPSPNKWAKQEEPEQPSEDQITMW